MQRKKSNPLEIGQKFGRMTVKKTGLFLHHTRASLMECECGNEKIIRDYSLRAGVSTSCGCFQRESTSKRHKVHGKEPYIEYCLWNNMKQRCSNPKNTHYKYYGGRGVKVCDRWLESFENFLSDMGSRPDGLSSIDRIDNNGNYEPGNCRWATAETQANNKTNNRFISAFGKTMTMAEWSKAIKINYFTLFSRLKRGWSNERSLTP